MPPVLIIALNYVLVSGAAAPGAIAKERFMFAWLVGSFVVLSLLGWKVIHSAQQEDKRKPRPKKREQY